MKDHIPVNKGKGKWETARIPFKTFHPPKTKNFLDQPNGSL
jgi:hypothetical protein